MYIYTIIFGYEIGPNLFGMNFKSMDYTLPSSSIKIFLIRYFNYNYICTRHNTSGYD